MREPDPFDNLLLPHGKAPPPGEREFVGVAIVRAAANLVRAVLQTMARDVLRLIERR